MLMMISCVCGGDIIGCVGVHESVGGYYFVEGCFFLIFYNYDNVICGKMFSPNTYCFQLLFFFSHIMGSTDLAFEED